MTYQATFQRLREKFGFTNERIKELFDLSIKMAEEAIDDFMIDYEKRNQKPKKIRPIVAVSIGSYG